MKIVSQTPAELVVRDSSMWLSAIFALLALMPLYIALAHNDRRAFTPAAVLLLIAFVWARRSTFTFSAATQRIEWSRLRWLRAKTGTIPFSDVQGIQIQSISSDKGVLIYRLAIATTSQGIIPMSDEYSGGGLKRYEDLRDTLWNFVRPERPTSSAFSPSTATLPINPDAARTAALNDSIRGLLQQGRKVDAILLVRESEHLDLTEATFRVNHIESELKSSGVQQ
jgi:hypothetical protein